MPVKPHQIILIEPDSMRAEQIRSILAKNSSAVEFEVVSSMAEARLQVERFPSAMVFSAQSARELLGETDRDTETGGDIPSVGQAEAGSDSAKLATLSHALRGSLGVILNAVFLLKRKGAEDRVLFEKFLEIIKQETESAERILSEHLRSARVGPY